jgi:dihydrofolate synthase/folylpolyglutamate synthase
VNTVPTIRTIAEAEVALQRYVPLVGELSGKDMVLVRIAPLMKLLSNPEARLQVIHIAGTSGKTSTAYYMAAMLVATDVTVGLTVSPHVDSITERVQINGAPLDDALFCSELALFLELVERAEQPPTYFELMYAFALWEFERRGVDYAVVETGMGGLYDATNVTARPDKVCIITDIGFDHMHILGNSLPEIAAQKIGIVHQDNQVFCYQQVDEVMEVFRAWCSQHAAILNVLSNDNGGGKSDNVVKIADYQLRNWRLAQQVYDFLVVRDGLKTLTSQALQKTQELQIPARMDVRRIAAKTIVMDGAHNAQKMTAFVQSYNKLYPNTKPAILIALKRGKEYKAVVPLLAQLTNQVIITSFATSQDLPVVSMDPIVLAEAFKEAGVAQVLAVPDHSEAFRQLLALPGKDVIITGSFYLLSQIRKLPDYTATA